MGNDGAGFQVKKLHGFKESGEFAVEVGLVEMPANLIKAMHPSILKNDEITLIFTGEVIYLRKLSPEVHKDHVFQQSSAVIAEREGIGADKTIIDTIHFFGVDQLRFIRETEFWYKEEEPGIGKVRQIIHDAGG